MHLSPLIHDLAIILGVAGLVSVIFQRIHQPVVLGYIVAGIIIGPYTPPYAFVTDIPSIQTWGELGVIFLMFSLGLEFNFKRLNAAGLSTGLIACFEVCCMVGIGFLVGKFYHWSFMDSLFLGAMISISSTTIIIKTLTELGLKTRRFSEMIFAVLIFEDLVAIIVLVAFSALASGRGFSGWLIFSAIGRLVVVATGLFVAGYFLAPRWISYVSKIKSSDETLTISAIGLCLLFVLFASYFHYSVALGAFLMGSILSENAELARIQEKIQPLQDLFAAVFFVSVGMLIDPIQLRDHWEIVLVVTACIILGKIISASLGAILTGQSLKNSIQMGFGLAQIGEFSFIIAGLGISLGVISDFIYPVGVAVSLITTLTTPYLLRFSEKFATLIDEQLPPGFRSGLLFYDNWIQSHKVNIVEKKKIHRLFFRWAFYSGILLVFLLVGTELILPLFLQYFPFWVVSCAILLMVLFSLSFLLKQIEKLYRWFEKQSFMKWLIGKELKQLAPWDAHLIKIRVHPNSEFVLQRLSQAQLRSHFGLNIIAFQRGKKITVAPDTTEFLLPYDELLVLTTDEQLEGVRSKLELPKETQQEQALFSEYELRQIKVEEQFGWNGRPIIDLSTKNFDAVIVGIERFYEGSQGFRILNPNPDFRLASQDILWIVGEKRKLDQFASQVGVTF